MSNLNLGSFGDKRQSPRLNADALNHLPKHRRDYLEIFSDVQGNARKVMPGTCEACVWGNGEHAAGCTVAMEWRAGLAAAWAAERKRRARYMADYSMVKA